MAYQRKPKAHGYADKLAEPMPNQWELGGLLDFESEAKFLEVTKRRAVAVLRDRTLALFDHYRVNPSDPDAWQKLALRLAFKHVPGFQPRRRKPVGKPQKWDDALLLKLHADVMKLRRRGLTLDKAIEDLRTRGGAYRNESRGNLKRRFTEALESVLLGRLLKRLRAEGAPVDDWIIEAYGPGKAPGKKGGN